MKSLKLLEENIGRTLFDINYRNIFGEKKKKHFWGDPNEIKAKINK